LLTYLAGATVACIMGKSSTQAGTTTARVSNCIHNFHDRAASLTYFSADSTLTIILKMSLNQDVWQLDSIPDAKKPNDFKGLKWDRMEGK
jgi:hypothetical protein